MMLCSHSLDSDYINMKLGLLFVLAVHVFASSSKEDAADVLTHVGEFQLPLSGSLWIKIHFVGEIRYSAHPAANGPNYLVINNPTGVVEGEYQFFEITCDSSKAVLNHWYQFIVSETPRNINDGHIFIPPSSSIYSVRIV